MYTTKMNNVFALMHFMWSGYLAWVMHGLVQAGPSVAVLWDASLMTAVLHGWLLLYEEDEQCVCFGAFHVILFGRKLLHGQCMGGSKRVLLW
jgi:hypothetical protein